MKTLFLHMPKCAGTSIRTVLEETVPTRLKTDYDSYFKIPLPERSSHIEAARRAPLEVEDGQIIYGHFFPIKYMPMDRSPPYNLITILRDPVSRVQSHYNFWRKGDFSDHYLWRKMIAADWSFEQFALSTEMQNFYCQYLTGISFDAFTYIGLYERLDESLQQCLSMLDIGQHSSRPLPRHNEAGQPGKALPDSLMARLRDHHADDYALYERARARFHPE